MAQTARNRSAQRRRHAAARGAPAATSTPAATADASPLLNFWSAWPDQLRRIGEQTLRDLARDAQVGHDEVQQASTPHDLWSRQLEFGGEVWLRLARGWVQFAGAMLDAQTAWLRDAEARVAEAMRPFGDGGHAGLGSAQPLFEPPLPIGPAQVVETMQRAWSESAGLWFNAISHDLQAAGAQAH